jgi:hypothetical protein
MDTCFTCATSNNCIIQSQHGNRIGCSNWEPQLSEEYLIFKISGRYILPCELKNGIGENNYKSLMKLIRNDIKLLKEYKIIR